MGATRLRWGHDYLQLLFGVLPQGLLKASGSVPQRLALEGQCVYLVLQGATRRPAQSTADTAALAAVRRWPPWPFTGWQGRRLLGLPVPQALQRGGHVVSMPHPGENSEQAADSESHPSGGCYPSSPKKQPDGGRHFMI